MPSRAVSVELTPLIPHQKMVDFGLNYKDYLGRFATALAFAFVSRKVVFLHLNANRSSFFLDLLCFGDILSRHAPSNLEIRKYLNKIILRSHVCLETATGILARINIFTAQMCSLSLKRKQMVSRSVKFGWY